jgi:hypothetical protein
LTPGPSFAHNLGYRCPNGQCEAIFYIYASRPFQWHQEHLNARCFGPCCRALNIRESRRTPNPHFFQVLGFTPTLGQSRVATSMVKVFFQNLWNQSFIYYYLNAYKQGGFQCYFIPNKLYCHWVIMAHFAQLLNGLVYKESLFWCTSKSSIKLWEAYIQKHHQWRRKLPLGRIMY